jgi:meso-butanediol dehydrogenase/(S,S)-butanediol dehydrogenase/diacetyl reductase
MERSKMTSTTEVQRNRQGTPSLGDRVIVVTGAGSGIGRGIAVAVAEEGGAVVALDLDLASARETAAAVEQAGAAALPLGVDVTDTVAVTGAIAVSAGRFDRIDGWVNNAGLLRMGAALDSGDDDWGPQLEVNSRAVYSCCRLAARRMIEQGPSDRGAAGAIVNVASNAGKVGYPNMAAYNASKAAVISLTRSLAAEWAEHGINVNAVCPGGVETPMLSQVAEWIGEKQGLDPEMLLAEMKPAQLGRHIRPIEVGRVVAFLLSDRAAIIRGQSINVDGGDTPY